MKLTMEPTSFDGIAAGYPAIEIQVISDDIPIGTMGELFASLLLAMGYHPENVKDLINV